MKHVFKIRRWHVILTERGYEVVREDNHEVYAVCTNHANAANVCTALNFHEQWVMENSEVA